MNPFWPLDADGTLTLPGPERQYGTRMKCVCNPS